MSADRLEHWIDQALRASVEKIRCKEEPDYTAALAKYLPSILRKKRILSSRYRFGGCFIHQKPKVKFKNPETNKSVTCEAGDLLVLFRDVGDEPRKCWAALLQAKIHRLKKNEFHVCKSHSRQFRLYSTWPKFCFDGREFSGKEYDIQPKQPFAGAEYMFIRKKKEPLFTVSHVNENMDTESLSFAKYLCEFMEGKDGRELVCDEWSHFIEAMIASIRDALFNRSRAGLIGCKRTSGDFFDEFFDELLDAKEPVEIPATLSVESPNAMLPGAPVSVLLIEKREEVRRPFKTL